MQAPVEHRPVAQVLMVGMTEVELELLSASWTRALRLRHDASEDPAMDAKPDSHWEDKV